MWTVQSALDGARRRSSYTRIHPLKKFYTFLVRILGKDASSKAIIPIELRRSLYDGIGLEMDKSVNKHSVYNYLVRVFGKNHKF